MGIDASIAMGVQPVNLTQTISSLLGLRSQVNQQQLQQQAMQSNAMANQQSQIDLQETQNAQGLMSNIKKYQDSEGNIDFNKLGPDMAQAAPKNWAGFMTNIMKAQQAHTDAQNSVNSLDANARAQVGSILYPLKGQQPEVVSNTLDQLGSAYPTLAPAVNYFKKQISPALQSGNQGQIDSALDQAGKMIQPTNTQQDMGKPEGMTVNDGATTKVVSTKPGTSVPPGQIIPGTQATLQLPPTTTMTGPDGTTSAIGPHASVAPIDTSGVQGPQRGAILADIARNNPDPSVRAQAGQVAQGGRGAAFPGSVPTSLPIGAAEGITGPVAVANQHYAQVQADAATAPNRIAALQTIKQQIPAAIMGGGSAGDYLRSLSRTFGVANDAATANDVMAKNLAVLAAQGGNTDAARSLGEMGNPSYHMTAAAANKAVDQLAGIEAKKQAAGAFFSGTPTNSPTYANKMQMWSRYGDPRAFEYASKSPEDRAAMRAEMQKAGTWSTLQNNMQHLDAMGVEPQ